MDILRYPLGQLQANCYFLIEGRNCSIIDPADEASFILEEIQRRKLKLVGMLATHGHFDHVMAAGEIQLSFDAPLYIHKEDSFLIDRLEETAEYFLEQKLTIIKPKRISYLNDTFKITHYGLQILHTTGHTPGSCCFYFKKEKILFTGDTLFKQGIGRFDFSYSDKMELKRSLDTLFRLPKDTVVYPGHGEKTTIGNETGLEKLIV